VATVKNAVNGFRKAGIEPFNHNASKEADYSGALITQEPLPLTWTTMMVDLLLLHPMSILHTGVYNMDTVHHLFYR